jgi:outer membrane protein OmpA-like peptidoglycan-associated protein
MKTLCIFFSLLILGLTSADAQTAVPLDTAAAKATLGTRVRNPVKSSAPIVKRSYGRNPDKGLDVEIIERSDGTREEHPYVAVPILFLRSKDELLDEVSQANVAKSADLLRDLIAQGGRFTIQGHTSAEGDRSANQRLSEERAAKIHGLLLAAGLEAKHLAQAGFGPDCAVFPASAPEHQLQQDRRVLIVRNN